MASPPSTIFEEIYKSVVEDLSCDDLYSDELVNRIKELFEDGKITDQCSLLNALKGESSEDSRSRD